LTLIEQGLLLSLLGLILTFAALGLLILTIVILQRLFGTREPAPSQVVEPDVADGAEEPMADVAAAIAAAVLLLRSRDRSLSPLGQRLEAGPSLWWQGPQSPPPAPRHHSTHGRTDA
jgi:Na+-transporting methylmalonyl-CoA/oxaloacetate decarboxylase gamma subunit